MKKILILISVIFVLVTASGSARADDVDSVKTFLFPEFKKGYVVLKDRNIRLSAQLNYDLIGERMLYIENEDVLNELDANSVILVTIEGRSFFPAGDKAFYERIEVGGDKEFYICHKSKVLSKGKAAGYGSYSQTSSIGGLAVSTNAGNLYLLGPEEKMAGVDESFVCIKSGKKFEKINTLKNLVKLFKSHQTEIETFAKENKTNFNKIESVKTIIEYVFSL